MAEPGEGDTGEENRGEQVRAVYLQRRAEQRAENDGQHQQGGFAAFVLLCGIVVNAGIYLINEEDNWAANTRKRGIPLYLKAYNHKIVPILLTIVSTVLGLVPFLYDGPEEVFWFAFAVAAISGTLFSILALVVYLPIFLPMRRKTRKTV